MVPIALLHIRAFDTEQAAGNTFESVDQARHRVLRRIVDEQVHVFGFGVHLDQLSLEVQADLLENGLEPLEGVSVKHLSSIFCEFVCGGCGFSTHADFVSAVNIREAGLASLACRSSSREVSPSWQEPTEGIHASAWNQ